VQHFLNFARLPAARISACDLGDVIRQAWDSVRVRATQQRVQAKLALPAEPITVRADPDQLKAVIVNLLLNALDAMKTEGRIDVDLAKTGAAIEMRIRDTGPGIDADIRSRLFQPFATSKPQGTGLGLFLASRILDEHGGSIRADNVPTGGACFTIRLPSSGDEVAP
jgi:two-component system sensor histidine kinase HydH